MVAETSTATATRIIRSQYPDVEIPEVTLTELVLGEAAARGDKPAIIDGASGRTITYAQLVTGVRRTAAGLAAHGLSKGDVLGIYSPNVPEYAVAFHAVAGLGGVATTINPLYTPRELAQQLNDSRASYLLTVPPFMDKAREAAARSDVKELFVFGEAEGATPFAALAAAGAEAPEVDIDLDDVVSLPYSSGTTGLPKGVMLTHRNLVANICQSVQGRLRDDDERVIAVLPFFHIYGLVWLMNIPLYLGSTTVTMPRFELAEFLRVIQHYRITRAHLVPPIVLGLVKSPLVDDYDLSSLQFLGSGAAPLSAELEVACGKRLGCRMLQGYGLTETSPTTHLVTDKLAGQMPGSIGSAIPNTECRIVDVATGDDVPTGEPGELLIRGPQVMKGYLNKPEATAQAIDPDGWLHTSDIALVDEHGGVRIVDRVKELIKYKGYQIAPAELEALLLTHPEIADAAVIGVPDEDAGEVPKAFVVTTGSITSDEVTRFVAEHVAPYKKVRAVEIVEEIPKSPSGKILRRVLIDRERAAAMAG
jgi:acyl-CoA synthetase (AMP-forming)/AMP-acid ligase II